MIIRSPSAPKPSISAAHLTPAIRVPLDRLRSLIRNYVILQSLVWASLFAISFFWVASLIDYGPVLLGSSESPIIARGVLLAIWILGPLWILVRYGLMRWWVRWPYSSLALLVERYHPQFQSRLVTTVQSLEGEATYADRSRRGIEEDVDSLYRELHERTRQAAIGSIGAVDVTSILRWRALHFQLALLVALMIGSILWVAWKPDWSGHWVKRFFSLSDEPWPRLARLRLDGLELEIPPFTGMDHRQRYLIRPENNHAFVTLGRAATLKISADLSAQQIPEACTVSYWLANGTAGRSNMRRLNASSDRWQTFLLEGPPLEAIDQRIDLSVLGGDVRLPTLRIEPVDNPLLSQLTLDVKYPAYLQRSMQAMPESESLDFLNGMRIPQGTQVTLRAKANVPLDRVEYIAVPASAPKDQMPQVNSVAVRGQDFLVPLGQLDDSRLVEFRLWDQHQLSSDRTQQYVFSVAPDDVPRVDFALRGIGPAVTPQAVIPFAATIEDDHGVRQAWIEVRGSTADPVRSELQLTVAGRAESQIDLRALAEAEQLRPEVSTTLTLLVIADDHFDLSAKAHSGRSTPIQLAIVTPDQLMVMLERRELAMRSRLELILSELQQMRDLLVKMEGANASRNSKSEATQPSVAIVQQNNASGSNERPPTSPSVTDGERNDNLQTLRAQQCLTQTRKSESELKGIAQEISQIRDELINNRIDSQDRQDRLETRIRVPIQSTLDEHFGMLAVNLLELETNLPRGSVPQSMLTQPIQRTDQILVELQSVLQSMIDIQDFNEVIDMVRGIIDDQKNLLDKTKNEQTKQVLELFNEKK